MAGRDGNGKSRLMLGIVPIDLDSEVHLLGPSFPPVFGYSAPSITFELLMDPSFEEYGLVPGQVELYRPLSSDAHTIRPSAS